MNQSLKLLSNHTRHSQEIGYWMKTIEKLASHLREYLLAARDVSVEAGSDSGV